MNSEQTFDEMWGQGETLRSPYAEFNAWFEREDEKGLRAKQREAEDLFRLTGITFNVYGRDEAEERLIPFDIVPRIITAEESEKTPEPGSDEEYYAKFEVPDDLATSIGGLRSNWEDYPRSVKRGTLEWIKMAKTAPTRAKRIGDVVESLRKGLRPSPFRR